MRSTTVTSILSTMLLWSSLAYPQTVDYDSAINIGDSLAAQVIESGEEWIRQQSDTAIECGQVLVADGDSWFDYPLRSDIVTELERQQWAVLSAAHHGDTLEEIVYDAGQLTAFYRVLSRAFHYDKLINYDQNILDCRYDVERKAIPKAIILSAGGNDILGGLFAYLIERGGSSASEVLNEQMVDGLFYRMERILFEYISAIRYLCQKIASDYTGDDTACTNIPIFIHGYDYAQATGKGYDLFMVRFAGPWITPALRKRGRGSTDGNEAVRTLVNEYNDLLCHVAENDAWLSGHNPVYYLDFRNVVGHDWRDEIHPNAAAAQKLAAETSQAVLNFHRGALAPKDCP